MLLNADHGTHSETGCYHTQSHQNASATCKMNDTHHLHPPCWNSLRRQNGTTYQYLAARLPPRVGALNTYIYTHGVHFSSMVRVAQFASSWQHRRSGPRSCYNCTIVGQSINRLEGHESAVTARGSGDRGFSQPRGIQPTSLYQMWALLAKEAVMLGECTAATEYLAEAQRHNDAFCDRDNIIRYFINN